MVGKPQAKLGQTNLAFPQAIHPTWQRQMGNNGDGSKIVGKAGKGSGWVHSQLSGWSNVPIHTLSPKNKSLKEHMGLVSVSTRAGVVMSIVILRFSRGVSHI